MKKNLLLALLLVASALSLTSCNPAPPQQDHVAIVNGAPVSVDEFARESASAAERYPGIAADPGSEEALAFVLDSVILKKLMIQEAARMGLSEDREFLDTIKMFWEQTLIKKLIDARNKEFSKSLTVSDQEAEAHWRSMSARLTMLVIEAGSEQEAQSLSLAMAQGTRPAGAELLGPLMIEDLDPADPLCALFGQPDKKTAVLKEDGGYLAVRVLRRDAVQTPPFSAISAEIKEALLERKKERAFSDWLEGVKKSADIEIDRDALERAIK